MKCVFGYPIKLSKFQKYYDNVRKAVKIRKWKTKDRRTERWLFMNLVSTEKFSNRTPIEDRHHSKKKKKEEWHFHLLIFLFLLLVVLLLLVSFLLSFSSFFLPFLTCQLFKKKKNWFFFFVKLLIDLIYFFFQLLLFSYSYSHFQFISNKTKENFFCFYWANYWFIRYASKLL